jgi:hypothetical protein
MGVDDSGPAPGVLRPASEPQEPRRVGDLLFPVAAVAVVTAAAVLRSRGLDASLFEDEVWVAELVKHGGWHTHAHATPPLFYLLLRGWAAIRGTSDAAMRELPAIFGVVVAAIPFFAPLPRMTRFVWAALFAFSSPLVFYSTRIKQYTLEATVCMLMIVLLLRALRSDARRDWIAFFAVSALGVLTLYSPIFIAGAALLALLATRRTRPALLTAAIVLLGIAAYFGWLAPGAESIRLHGDMSEFFGRNGRWVTSPRVFLRGTAEWVGQALNLVRFSWLALLLGAAWLVRTRDRAVAVLVIAPPLAAALASIGRLYPYGEVRLMIFCFPALYLLVAGGLAWVAEWFPPLLLVLIPFALHADKYNDTYMHLDDLRPIYDLVAREHVHGERIVADPSFAAPLRYYHPELGPDIFSHTLTGASLPGWYIQKKLDPRGATTMLRIGEATAARFTR